MAKILDAQAIRAKLSAAFESGEGPIFDGPLPPNRADSANLILDWETVKDRFCEEGQKVLRPYLTAGSKVTDAVRYTAFTHLGIQPNQTDGCARCMGEVDHLFNIYTSQRLI